MGLFDDEKIVTVSSTMYNLAGDEEDRPDFLKSTLFGAIIANRPSLGEEITQSYLHGPGINMRQFFNWCKRNDFVGLPDVTFQRNTAVDSDVVAAVIGVPADPPGLEIVISNAEISDGSYVLFAEKYIFDNHPDKITDDWIAGYDPSTNTITIQFEDGSTAMFNPVGYNSKKQYISAKYYYTEPSNETDWVSNPVESIDVLPDLSDWEEIENNPSFTVVPLTRTANVVVSYNNGDPDENSSYDASTTGEQHTSTLTYEVHERSTDDPSGTKVVWDHNIMYLTATDHVTNDYNDVTVVNEDLGGGVIKTTTTTVTGQQVTDRWDSQTDERVITEGAVFSDEDMYIYEIGSGEPTLDALVEEAQESGWEEFFPYIPLRLKNKALDHSDFINSGLYDECRTAYRRATNGEQIDDILASIEDNDDVDDIDYASLVYGVSINVKEQACRRYIAKFFQEMIPFQNSNSNTIADFQAGVAAHEAALLELEEWEADAAAREEENWATRSRPPEVPKMPSLPTTTVRLRVDDSKVDDFDTRIYWNHIEQEVVDGTFEFTDPDTLVTRQSIFNECAISSGGSITWRERDGYNQPRSDNAEPTVRYTNKSVKGIQIRHQISDTQHVLITVYGLVHKNVIYDGEYVKITANEALGDEDISGFVIPLHYQTMIELGIKDYTQMSTACTHVMFNAYEVVTRKWYEKGIFKILLVILVIVIAVIVFPGAFAGGGGLLGGNLAVGGALGLSGTAALVAGVVANYLAALVVSQMLSPVLTNIFGEKWGPLIGALLSFAIGFAAGGFQFNIKNLLGFTNALANGYAGYMQGETAEMYQDFEKEREKYEKEMERIQDLIDGLGGNDLYFDPLSLTDTSYGNGSSGQGSYVPETVDEFIQRTMMTGSDLVQISQSLVYDHAQISTTLPQK